MSGFIESAAVLSGPAALVVSRVLSSPNVVKVLSGLPPWLAPYRSEISAAVQAIHRAAKAFETAATAPGRDTATVVGAVTLDSNSEWTVRKAADYLGLSRRRVQELAGQLGGRRVGRLWILDEVTVRELARQRRGAA